MEKFSVSILNEMEHQMQEPATLVGIHYYWIFDSAN